MGSNGKEPAANGSERAFAPTTFVAHGFGARYTDAHARQLRTATLRLAIGDSGHRDIPRDQRRRGLAKIGESRFSGAGVDGMRNRFGGNADLRARNVAGAVCATRSKRAVFRRTVGVCVSGTGSNRGLSGAGMPLACRK